MTGTNDRFPHRSYRPLIASCPEKTTGFLLEMCEGNMQAARDSRHGFGEAWGHYCAGDAAPAALRFGPCARTV
ncbi:MAG: hypothetical protein OXE82_16315 [Rhodobacter sp.]|nr:hypothetical protein [Rhodobacter sp.]